MLKRYFGMSGVLLLALASPAYGVDGINSSSGSPLPIGAGGNGPFINVLPSGQIEVPSGVLQFVGRSKTLPPMLSMTATGGVTFYVSESNPIRFKGYFPAQGKDPALITDLGHIILPGRETPTDAIFRFPSIESTTTNGPAGVFKGDTGGITVSTRGGTAGSFIGAREENVPALQVRMPYMRPDMKGSGAYAADFLGDNGISVRLHDSDFGTAGYFGGNVKITKNLTVGGITTAGVPVGVVTVGGATMDNNTVLTANSLRDNVVDNCFTSSATGTGVVTKTAKNQFVCTTIIPGAGATGPQGPAGPQGPPGTIEDISCPIGQVLTGVSKGQPVCGGVVLASYYQEISEGWSSEVIDLPQDGVLNAHCFGAANISMEGSCPGDRWNTGVQAIIDVDGVVCSHDVSFNFPSCRVTFRATASCARPLAAGRHTISCYVGRYGDDTNAETFQSSSFGFNVIAK